MRSIAVHLMSEGEGIGLVDYVVSPQGLQALKASRIAHRVLIEDLQPLIDEERQRLAGGGVAGANWFDDYKTYDEHNTKLAELEALRPDLASVFLVGLSLEGREIRGIRITGPGADKPAVMLNGTQHAREWIAPMVSTSTAERLVPELRPALVVVSLGSTSVAMKGKELALWCVSCIMPRCETSAACGSLSSKEFIQVDAPKPTPLSQYSRSSTDQ